MISESDLDHSDYTHDDQKNEHEIDPWASLENGCNERKIFQNLKS